MAASQAGLGALSFSMRSVFTWPFSRHQALRPGVHNAAELVTDLAEGVERRCQFLLDLPRKVLARESLQPTGTNNRQ